MWWEQAHLLNDVADASPQLGPVKLANVLALERNRAGGRLDEAVDHAELRGLAATRGSQQHDEGAGGISSVTSTTAAAGGIHKTAC
jgi:hypothetical protein